MRSPKDMQIIQIDITNACVYQCSNCTRFCGHHKKPYFMDLDYIKKAIDSLDGFDAIIGIMGGEPTLHPDFDEIARYLSSKYPKHLEKRKRLMHPQSNFLESMRLLILEHQYKSNDSDAVKIKGPGICSVMGDKYKEHYEVIQDTFNRQILNDHFNPMYHKPILITRKELGIPDDEWIDIRDNCWVQNEWSATITPKGAFFCEIAGSLDMLFDGPGGWDVEPGWWKRDVSDFKDQLHWCELCGIACDTFSRNANEEIDDVSPVLYKKLEEINSRKLRAHKINIINIKNNKISDESKANGKWFADRKIFFAESIQDKFNAKKSVLFPKHFEAICYIDEIINIDEQKIFASANAQFDIVHILFKTKDIEKLWTFNMDNKKAYILDEMNHADIMNTILSGNIHNSYIVTLEHGILPKHDFVSRMKKFVFNPGTLIKCDDIPDNNVVKEWITISNIKKTSLYIFNKKASSISNNTSKLNSLNELPLIWNKDKIVYFDENLFYSISIGIQANKKYAVYGTGEVAAYFYKEVKAIKSDVVFFVDSDTNKHGSEFLCHIIESPEALYRRRDEYDYILIGSHRYYYEIKKILLDMGFENEESTVIF